MKYDNREDIIQITPLWKGERFPDGRPKVPSSVLERLRHITIEEAWGPLWREGYKFQFEGDLKRSNPEIKMVGRAVTGVMVPYRPDLREALLDYGHEQEGRHGNFNQWLIDSLVEDDVLVVDMYDKIVEGTYVGGNLSTAIATRTKRGGAVFWGGVRDYEQIVGIPNLQIYCRGVDPTAIDGSELVGFNTPCRIGKAICLPGDVVLGTLAGVIFIPAHMAEAVADNAEKSQIRDVFGFTRLREGKYTTAQVDAHWTVAMFDDFLDWLKTSEEGKAYAHLDWTEDREEHVKWEKEHTKDTGEVTL